MIITNSMIRAYMRCRRKYAYKYQDLLTPRREGSIHLKRGKWLHALLETKYDGGDWHTTHDELTAEFNRMFEEERDIYGDLPTHCFRIMRAYDYYWRKADEDFDIVEVETTYDVPLPHGHVFRFRLDGLLEDEYGLWLFEHKSHLSIPKSDYRFIDPQTARYFWALEQVKDRPLAGVMWNYLSTLNLSQPQLTQTGRLSRKRIRTDPLTYIEGLKELGLDPAEYPDDILKAKRRLPTLYRRERVPKPPEVSERLVKEMVKVADEIERGVLRLRTIERTCETQCEYIPLCLTSLYGGDTKSMRRMNYRKATADDYYGFEDATLK